MGSIGLNNTERKLIIGIDFGTTYTGVAWAQTKKEDRRAILNVWPTSRIIHEGESSEKVPTKIRYVDGDEPEWGFSIPILAPQSEIMEWFKLDLDPEAHGFKPPPWVAHRPSRHPAEKLATDYLCGVSKHVKRMLQKRLGHHIMKTTPIEFVVTVSAIWSDLAKDKTLKACEKAFGDFAPLAGKVPIHLISEPEAAAIFVLHGLDEGLLEVDDTFIIMDAGGGTVDLITYTITKLSPLLEVEEAAPGSGGTCGSIYLNNGFREFLNQKLGSLHRFTPEVEAEAMEQFERIKRRFTVDCDPHEEYSISVGGVAKNKSAGIKRDGRLSVKGSDLHAIFKPIINECLQLLQEQIRASKKLIKAVLLVGGFGTSNYLDASIQKAIGGGIMVLRPDNAWQAVVQGAVMKGFVSVQGRKARKHYGMKLWVPRDESDPFHLYELDDQKAWDAMDGQYRVPEMNWIIKRGNTVSEVKPSIMKFHISRLVDDERIMSHTATIYVDNLHRPAARAMDADITVLCHLEADLSHLPRSSFTHRKGKDGRWYYVLSFHIKAIFLSASTSYTLVHNGIAYDTVTAEYV